MDNPVSKAYRAAPYGAYLLLALLFINQPPMHEEVMHVRDTGSWASALSYSCHPPMYVILGRLARSIFGEGYTALYIIGISAGVINLFLTGKILQVLLKDMPRERSRVFSIAGMWIAVLMPVFVHGSLLLEMEPTVLTPLVLLAVFYYIKNEGQGSTRFYLFTGVLFALAMWAKYFFTPFLLIFSIFAYELSSGKKFTDSLKSFFIVLGSALALFVPTYLIYSSVFIEGANSFAFLALDKTREGAPLLLSGKAFFPAATKLMALTFWLSPFFIIAFILLCFRMALNWHGYRKERFFLIAIAAIFIFYLLMHPYPFGESKYFYPMFPLTAILTASLIARDGIKFPPLNYAFALMPPVSLITFLVLGDPLYQAIGSYRSLSMGRLYSYLLLYLSINLALFVALYAFFSFRGFKAFPASLLYMSVCSSLSLFANQAVGQYQTRSQYGEKGALETVSFIRSEIPLSSRVIVPGDIGFYAGAKFAKASPIEEGSATVPEWDWIVERRANIIRLKPEDIGAIYANYRLFKSIGSYEIYRRR